jgi:hypothetical protein
MDYIFIEDANPRSDLNSIREGAPSVAELAWARRSAELVEA